MFSKPCALNAGNKRVGLDERREHYSAESLHLGGGAAQAARVWLDFGSLLLQVRERFLTT